MQLDANGNTTAFMEMSPQPPREQKEDLSEMLPVDKLVGKVSECFYKAETARRDHENRWEEAFHNYRGKYNKNFPFRETEKSRVFVKITKTKVLASYGQLIDVVFGANKFPVSIKETVVPEHVPEFAHLSDQNIEAAVPEEAPVSPESEFDVGFAGDGVNVPPGAKLADIIMNKRGSKEVLKEGVGRGGEPTVKPAATAARRMEKLIHDQIEESDGVQHLRKALFEGVLLGTGIIKGPFNYNKPKHKWIVGEDGSREHVREERLVPKIEHVSLWNFYPDPEATCINDASYVIQRHKLNSSEMRALMNRPFFIEKNIMEVLKQGPNYTRKDFETGIIMEDSSASGQNPDRWEVLEFWGVVEKDVLQGHLDIEYNDLVEIPVNVWVCGGKILRVVLNPFKTAQIPYHVFPYELNPYSIFGIGVAENMNDSQLVMNGHARMAIDNLALAGNLVFDIDESALVPGQSMEIYQGKVFKRSAGMPGQAVFGLKFPNTAAENLQMFDRFRQFADEETGIPSFSHGYTGVTGMTRTASGMSMLMGAASLSVKTVIKNVDDYLLRPLGQAFYHWNMQFYEGPLVIEGDLEVEATGTSSFMQKEVRSQRLTQILMAMQNPAVAPFIRVETVLKEIAYSLELDPEEFILSQDEAKINAAIMGMAGGVGGTQEGQGIPGLPQGLTGNGDGTIGAGAPPMPGEEGFSGVPATPSPAMAPPANV